MPEELDHLAAAYAKARNAVTLNTNITQAEKIALYKMLGDELTLNLNKETRQENRAI